MKLIYAAAAMIVVTGAAIGFVTAPAASQTDAQTDEKAAKEEPKRDRPSSSGRHGGGGGDIAGSMSALGAGDERPDCFYLRVAYNTARHKGSGTAERKQALDAGCWVPG